MGYLDELKTEYKKGQEDADRLFGKKDEKEANTATSEPKKKKLPIGQIVGAVVIGAIGALFLGIVGFLIGAVIGFFCGGFIWNKITGAGAAPKLSTDGEKASAENEADYKSTTFVISENPKQDIIGLFTEKETAYAFKGTVHLFDKIPEKKLQNAIKNYAPVKSGEEVVLLYDYSAKEGIVLTTNRLYVNQPTYSGCSVGASVAVSDINGFSHRKKGAMSPEEYIDIQAGSKILTIQYMYGKQLMSALEKTVSILKSSGDKNEE